MKLNVPASSVYGPSSLTLKRGKQMSTSHKAIGAILEADASEALEHIGGPMKQSKRP